MKMIWIAGALSAGLVLALTYAVDAKELAPVGKPTAAPIVVLGE